MVGYPWETKEDAQKTIAFAKKLFRKNYIDTMQATIMIPYPGTPLYKYCEENDLLLTKDYDRFDQRERVMKSELSDEDIKKMIRKLYRSFITPKFFLKKIIGIRSFNDLEFMAQAGKKVFGHLIDFS